MPQEEKQYIFHLYFQIPLVAHANRVPGLQAPIVNTS